MKKILSIFLAILMLNFLVGCDESHVHKYEQKTISPTCTEQGYTQFSCECGDSYKENMIDELGHSYSEWNLIIPATASTKGLKERTCSRCNDKQTEIIPEQTHEHEYTETVVAPTCVVKGYTLHTCSCGYSYEDNKVEALGHTEEAIAGKAATCIEKGLTEGKKCSVCGEVLVKQTEIEALGHKYGNWTVTKEATETEKGLKEQVCSICNDKVEEEIPELSHEHSYAKTVVAPTCVDKGYTLHTCSCGNSYKDTEKEALGHREEIILGKNATCTEKGLTDGKKCSVCNTILIKQEETQPLGHDYSEWKVVKEATETEEGLQEKVCSICNDKQTETISFDKKEYIIRWYWNNECLNVSLYNKEIGLLPEEMYKFEVEGYEYQGWYKSSEYTVGTKVDSIEKGTIGDINLYLKMSLIEYNIEYIDVYEHSNPLTYTINDSFKLKDASYPGMRFSRWIDENGNTIEEIEKGTKDNIKLYACYYTVENDIISYGNTNSIEAAYDEKDNTYCFLYPLGEINNVVLSKIDEFNKTTNQTKEWKQKYEQRYDETVSETVSNAVSEVVTETSDWEKSMSYAESISEGWENSVEASASMKFEKFDIGVKISGKITHNETTTDTYTNSYGGSSSTEQGKEKTISSAVSYDKSYSKSFETTDGLPSDVPNGTYRYVTTGTVLVYMFILYDVEKSNYYMSVYSILKNDISTTILYEPRNNTLNIDEKEELSYDIPFDYLDSYIKNSYLVNYDANGGEGEMEISLFSKEEQKKLSKNTFTKEGYTFSGWSTSKDGDIIYKNGASVKDITTPGNQITLYAKWIKESSSTLTITFDPGYGEGTMENQIVSYYEYQNLNKNNFKYTGYSFKGWAKIPNGEIIYNDEAEIHFEKIISENITLYAVWGINTYSLKIWWEPSVFVGEQLLKEYKFKYGETIHIDNPKIDEYIFYSYNTELPGKMPNYDIDVIATYLKYPITFVRLYEVTVTDSGREYQHYDKISIENIKKFQTLGYTKIKVTINVDIREINDGYQSIFLYNSYSSLHTGKDSLMLKNVNNKYCEWKNDHGGEGAKKDYGNYTISQTILIDKFINSNDGGGDIYNLYVAYGASGKNDDDWCNKNLKVTITFEKG